MTDGKVEVRYSGWLDYSFGVITGAAAGPNGDLRLRGRSFDSMDYYGFGDWRCCRREDCSHPILLSFLRVLAGSDRRTACGAPSFAVVFFAQ